MHTAFNTPFGRYCFKRMPYGIKSGSEVFQRTMEELFIHSPCEIVVDDILIWGKTTDELKSNTYKVLDRAREVGLKLNAKKGKFGVTEVTYVGHKLLSDGLKPDPAKVRAVKDMPKPKQKADVQRFLGVVNYLSKFIPDFSTKTEELLAVVFVCNKFHDYICGKRITVETNHQPLVSILNKPLHKAPLRLQRMMIVLQRYDINIVYKKGKELYVTDTLSRAYQPDNLMGYR